MYSLFYILYIEILYKNTKKKQLVKYVHYQNFIIKILYIQLNNKLIDFNILMIKFRKKK